MAENAHTSVLLREQIELFQWAKPAQDMRVGLHSASPLALPMDRLFIDFVGPLVRTKRGNIAILVMVHSFSKFVSFHPVRKMTSSAVSDYLEREYFLAYGTPKSIVTDNAKVFRCKEFRDLCFRWGLNTLLPPLITPKAPWQRELTGT